MKKEGKLSETIPEDDPVKYKHAIYVMVMKLFADMERRRQQLETRDMEERKRKREAEIEEEDQRTMNREWQKNFEVIRGIFCIADFFYKTFILQESRQNRVDSWHSFQAGGSKKKKAKKPKTYPSFNPPKIKPESRN